MATQKLVLRPLDKALRRSLRRLMVRWAGRRLQLLLDLPRVKIIEKRGGRVWMLADIKELAEDYIDVEGLRVRPTVVISVYCKLPERVSNKIKRRKELEDIRLKSPMLFTES